MRKTVVVLLLALFGVLTSATSIQILRPDTNALTLTYVNGREFYYDFSIKNISTQNISDLSIFVAGKYNNIARMSQETGRHLDVNQLKTFRVYFLINDENIDENVILVFSTRNDITPTSLNIGFLKEIDTLQEYKKFLILPMLGIDTVWMLAIMFGIILLLLSFRYDGLFLLECAFFAWLMFSLYVRYVLI